MNVKKELMTVIKMLSALTLMDRSNASVIRDTLATARNALVSKINKRNAFHKGT